MSNWQVGPVPIKVVGHNKEPETRTVAGWLKGNWGLDFRLFDISDYFEDDWRSGWMLTHLATGFSAFAILEPMEDAFRIADEIDAMADWNFENPENARSLSGIVPKVMQKFGDSVTRQTDNHKGSTFYVRAAA